uniref:Uncharacterized protein n=1 Tax=Prymnesium polylepis TaxID=72548 RepID=A0A7S4M209_9EUKA
MSAARVFSSAFTARGRVATARRVVAHLDTVCTTTTTHHAAERCNEVERLRRDVSAQGAAARADGRDDCCRSSSTQLLRVEQAVADERGPRPPTRRASRPERRA